MTDKLLPCPFCGSAPDDDYSNGERTISCGKDDCIGWRAIACMGPDRMSRMGLPRADYAVHAAKMWNTRAPATPPSHNHEGKR